MALITLKEYAARNNISYEAVLKRKNRGRLKTIVKAGPIYLIEENEKMDDRRVITGKYKGWRHKSLK